MFKSERSLESIGLEIWLCYIDGVRSPNYVENVEQVKTSYRSPTNKRWVVGWEDQGDQFFLSSG